MNDVQTYKKRIFVVLVLGTALLLPSVDVISKVQGKKHSGIIGGMWYFGPLGVCWFGAIIGAIMMVVALIASFKHQRRLQRRPVSRTEFGVTVDAGAVVDLSQG
jgi:hypothetical protein